MRSELELEIRAGFGRELGVNYHLRGKTSFTITLGYQNVFGGGVVGPDDDDGDVCAGDCGLFGDFAAFEDYRIREHVVSLKFSVLFRSAEDVFNEAFGL